jgi:stage II sporulation protein D
LKGSIQCRVAVRSALDAFGRRRLHFFHHQGTKPLPFIPFHCRALLLSLLLSLALSACGGKKTRIQAPTPAPSTTQTSTRGETPPASTAGKTPDSKRTQPPRDQRAGNLPPAARPRDQLPYPAIPPAARPGGPIFLRVALDVDQAAVAFNAPAETELWDQEKRLGSITGQAEVLIPVMGAVPEKFWVQVAAPDTEDEADSVLSDFRRKGYSGLSRWNERLQRYQIRLGPYQSRSRAEQVRSQTTPDAFIVSESMETSSTASLQSESDQWYGARFQLRPAEGRLLRFKGRSYRGWFEVFVNRKGSLTLVNVVELEDYLRGVVPNELSPYLFPQVEALKAQAIAARTYALRNRGQFGADGFDLFSTIRSQVYGGRESERPLSDEAIQLTQGLIATYQGQPIEALYSATCGGHTEDSSNVFSSREVPYLKGVPCMGEQLAEEGGEGLTIPAELTVDFSLGLVSLSGIDLFAEEIEYSRRISAAEMQSWTRRSAMLAGLSAPALSSTDVEGFFLWLSRTAGASEAEARYTPRDASLALKDFEDLDLLDLRLRPHVAWLLEKGILQAEGKRLIPVLPLRRGYVLQALGRMLQLYQQHFVRQGRITKLADGSVQIAESQNAGSYSFLPSLLLYRRDGRSLSPLSSLRLQGGEPVWFFADDQGLKLLMVENGKGPAAGALAPSATWEYRISRADLSKRINSLLPVGPVRDIEPVSYGVSGRVLKLRVASSRGETVLSGARLRTALGLRDTLFTLERSLNDDGVVERFIFRGRGWGHGVGLCQIGSVGLARQGKNFVEILKSYYSGIEIEPIAVEGK